MLDIDLQVITRVLVKPISPHVYKCDCNTGSVCCVNVSFQLALPCCYCWQTVTHSYSSFFSNQGKKRKNMSCVKTCQTNAHPSPTCNHWKLGHQKHFRTRLRHHAADSNRPGIPLYYISTMVGASSWSCSSLSLSGISQLNLRERNCLSLSNLSINSSLVAGICSLRF